MVTVRTEEVESFLTLCFWVFVVYANLMYVQLQAMQRFTTTEKKNTSSEVLIGIGIIFLEIEHGHGRFSLRKLLRNNSCLI